MTKWVKGKYITELRSRLTSMTDTHINRLIAIDPSSSYNKFAYSIFIDKEVVESSIIKVDKNDSIQGRLSSICGNLQYLTDNYNIQLVAIELLRGCRTTPTQLIWSVGAVFGSIGHIPTVEVATNIWKCITPPDYIKGDVEDSACIGRAVIELYKEAHYG